MKEAQEIPGAFSHREPYSMRERIERTLGSPAKPTQRQARTQIGTVGSSLNTIQGPVPKGMGQVKSSAVYRPGVLQMLKHVTESMKRVARLRTEPGKPFNIADILMDPLQKMEKAPAFEDLAGRQFFVKIPGERRIIGHVTERGEMAPHTIFDKTQKLDPTKQHVDLTEMIFGKQGQVSPSTTQKNLLGGGQTVGPRMRTVVKPTKPMSIKMAFPNPEQVMDALSEPDLEGSFLAKEGQHDRLVHTLEVLRHLETTDSLEEKLACVVELAGLRKEAFLGAVMRGAGAVARNVLPAVGGALRSRGFWTGAGVLGGGYGAYKLISGAGRKVEESMRTRKESLETPLPR